MIGLTIVEAEDIFKSFKEEFEARERQFKGPGGRPKKIDTRGIFVMLLMYYRHDISMAALGALFHLDDNKVKRWSDDAQRMLKEVLKKERLPLNRSGSQEEVKEVLQQHGKIYLDEIVQAIHWPCDKIEQKENDSGKKKQDTLKILVLSDENKLVLVITPVYVGTSYDFGMFKEEKMFDLLLPKTPIYTDTGFEGLDKLRDGLNIVGHHVKVAMLKPILPLSI